MSKNSECRPNITCVSFSPVSEQLRQTAEPQERWIWAGNLAAFGKHWFDPVASDSVPWGIVCGRMELLASRKLGMEKTGKEWGSQHLLEHSPEAWLTSIGPCLLKVPSLPSAAPARDQANCRGILKIRILAFNTSCFNTYPNTDAFSLVFN